MLLMNLESRPVIFEDIGRQVLSNGERKQPEYYYNCIGKAVVCLMVFNATFINISVISWRSVLLVEEATDLPQVSESH
jgi:hypothetical protein